MTRGDWSKPIDIPQYGELLRRYEALLCQTYALPADLLEPREPLSLTQARIQEQLFTGRRRRDG